MLITINKTIELSEKLMKRLIIIHNSMDNYKEDYESEQAKEIESLEQLGLITSEYSQYDSYELTELGLLVEEQIPVIIKELVL